VSVPRVAELSTCQNTLHGSAPLISSTVLSDAVHRLGDTVRKLAHRGRPGPAATSRRGNWKLRAQQTDLRHGKIGKCSDATVSSIFRGSSNSLPFVALEREPVDAFQSLNGQTGFAEVTRT